MRISEIRIIHYRAPLREAFTTSFGTMKVRDTVLIMVRDDEGNTGWGEAPVDNGPWYNPETISTAIHVIKDYIAPALKGKEMRHPCVLRGILSRIRGHNMAKAGVEFAIWDLYAKRHKEPLYRLIGGVKRKVEAGLSIGVIGDMDKLLKTVALGLDKGYRRIKIKIKPGWDILPVKKIRREYGDIPLQVDANAAYTLHDHRVFEELDKYGLLMIEQPLHYDDLYMHSILQRTIKTPICLDESIKNIYDAMAGHSLGSYKVINIKPARVGGLCETLAIHWYASQHSIPVWIGGLLETGIGRAFQVAAATLPNVRYPNDISESNRFYIEDVIETPWRLEKDGTYIVPEKPGIGVEVREDVIIRYTEKVLSISLG